MKSKFFYTIPAFLAILFFSVSGAFAVTLSMSNASGESPITTQITVDNPVGIAGAAITLNYDTTALNINVASDFFDTFENQLSGTSYTGPYTADGYDQPLVTNEVGTGMRIAAARCTPADNSNNVLFTLSISLLSGAAEQAYPITITATELNNTAAGYSESGETIDLLIGSDPTKELTDSAAFPVILAKDSDPATVFAECTVSPTSGFNLDIDGNGVTEAGKDAVLIIRYLSNYHALFPGVWTTGIIAPNATRDEAAIIDFIKNGSSQLDVDGNGVSGASTDAVLIIRFLSNYHALYPGLWTTGIISQDATRNEQEIIDYLKTLLP